ncbi:MAG: DUF1178 family protein [Methylocystaceae bacterium]|jgi:hypothetical protein|nr:DUF1178 family protein [Methylocystaceae bacterium]
MIHYQLVCDKGHEFDSWFKNSQTFDKQAKAGLIICPFCQSAKITRGVMAPHVARTYIDDAKNTRALINAVREKLIEATDDVGDQFPQEARKIEEGAAKQRPIRGRATFEEAKSLIEEGIKVFPLPDAPSEGN